MKPWQQNYPKGVNTEIHLNQYQNIMEVFDEAVRKFRTQKAYTNMGRSFTFEEIDTAVGNFASFLQHELKLKKGDRIAIQMPNLLQFPICLFGAFRAGLIVVNTNPLYTATEMQHQFKDSGAKAIVILENYAHLLQEILPQTAIESIVVTKIGDLLPFPKNLLVNSVVKYVKKMVPEYSLPHAYSFRQALDIGKTKAYQNTPLQIQDIAFLQYTGGTTGVSKGAILSHKNIIANMLQICEWMKPAFKEGQEVIITALPLYHIFSLTVNCLALMKYGGENILITNPRDIPGFIKTLQSIPFTIITGVNTLFNALMNHPDFEKIDFSHCKVCVGGAMAVQKKVAEMWQQKTKSTLFEGYGLTEASPVVCCNPVVTEMNQTGTIGMPLPSTDIMLQDDSGKPVAVGQAGELCCRGPQVMEGYWQRPDETNKVIIDGWLHTGDVAIMLENGYFKIVDRKKDMILVSGFNVYPNEVEDAIATHSDVLEVAAIGVADEKTGESVKVFVVKKNESLTEDEVIQHAKKTLTNYKVPRSVVFRKELPKTNVGKILRRALREIKPE